jgi:hypothetical protein
MDYDKKYNITLPKRTDTIYKNIENFENYELTYCIAYEMATRTKEFKELINKPETERDFKWEKEMLSLGFNDLTKCLLKQSVLLRSIELDYQICIDYWNTFKICDIKDGVNILLTYYFNKNEVYELNKNTKEKKYDKVDVEKFSYVSISPNDYYISCNKDGINEIIQIREELPLSLLDNELLSKLKLSDIKGQYFECEPIYNRPTLRFEDDRILNLPLNLNLNENELHAYLDKIIEDYKDDKSITQDSFEIFSDKEIAEAIMPKSYVKMPKEKRKKIVLADAFYIYDLFKKLVPTLENKYTKPAIKDKIIEISGFSQNAIEVYHAYMSDSIDEKGYKDLLLINNNKRSYLKEINALKRKIKKKISDRIKEKGASGKRLTEIERKSIIKQYENKIGLREIARSLNIRLSTVQYHIEKYNNKNEQKNKTSNS